jgi:hypothetical protein
LLLEILGCHGDYYHVVVVIEAFGFGAVCSWTFRRNILSPSSGAEVTRRGSRGVYIGPIIVLTLQVLYKLPLYFPSLSLEPLKMETA